MKQHSSISQVAILLVVGCLLLGVSAFASPAVPDQNLQATLLPTEDVSSAREMLLGSWTVTNGGAWKDAQLTFNDDGSFVLEGGAFEKQEIGSFVFTDEQSVEFTFPEFTGTAEIKDMTNDEMALVVTTSRQSFGSIYSLERIRVTPTPSPFFDTSLFTPSMGLSVISGLALFVFAVAFLVDWIRTRAQNWKYLKYGLLMGGIVLGVDLLTVAITPGAWSAALIVLICLEPIIFLRTAGFTMLGMLYAAELGLPSMPLLLQKFKLPGVETSEPAFKPALPVVESAPLVEDEQTDLQEVLEAPAPPSETPRPLIKDRMLRATWAEYLSYVFAVTLLAISYSVVLFLLTKPQISDLMQKTIGFNSSAVPQTEVTAQALMAVVVIAISEEIIFRLGIQNLLAKYLNLKESKYWIAILLTSILWTLGHAGSLSPEWVKLAQIFPIGLLFGWLYKRFGIESSMIAHAIFNFVLAFLSVYLIH